MKLLLALFVVAITAQNWGELIPIPVGQNQGGYTYPKMQTQISVWGTPCPLTTDCSGITNGYLKTRIRTQRIGKFAMTGHDIALDAFARAVAAMTRANPGLVDAVGTSGMTCCRAIRGSKTSWSNHAWGLAADFNVRGTLDPRGDGRTQRGMAAMYPFMHDQGFFWAAGYTGGSEDSMHFEIANELLLNYQARGDWGGCPGGRCIPVGDCGGVASTGECPGPAGIKCCKGAPKIIKCVTTDREPLRNNPDLGFALIPIPRGEPVEIIGGTFSQNNFVWRKVRARNAWTGFVPDRVLADCVGGRDYVDPNFNSSEIIDLSGSVSEVFPTQDEDAYGAQDSFEANNAAKIFSLVVAVVALFAF